MQITNKMQQQYPVALRSQNLFMKSFTKRSRYVTFLERLIKNTECSFKWDLINVLREYYGQTGYYKSFYQKESH
jgi:hypothetical protein